MRNGGGKGSRRWKRMGEGRIGGEGKKRRRGGEEERRRGGEEGRNREKESYYTRKLIHHDHIPVTPSPE